jgi:hypothetical protein
VLERKQAALKANLDMDDLHISTEPATFLALLRSSMDVLIL